MASVDELLLNSLKDLGKEELKTFQWHLKKNHKGLSNSELEDADRLKTVDKLVDIFGEEEAVKNMVKILRKMNKNNQAKQLEDNLKQAAAGESIDNPQIVEGSSKPIGATDISTARPPHGTSSLTNLPRNFTNIAPSNRNDFLKYSLQLTLDPNTAYKHLRLSDREVSYTFTDQSYRNHPDRFDYYHQVLCRESVSGRCYWEIEWSGDGVYVSVSYKSISRKGAGDECAFGQNDQSWCLYCSPSSYSIIHNDKKIDISVKPISRNIGVYVDYSAGTLSFYSISRNTMSLIHTVQTTFTQPLYPGFYLDFKSSVKLC